MSFHTNLPAKWGRCRRWRGRHTSVRRPISWRRQCFLPIRVTSVKWPTGLTDLPHGTSGRRRSNRYSRCTASQAYWTCREYRTARRSIRRMNWKVKNSEINKMSAWFNLISLIGMWTTQFKLAENPNSSILWKIHPFFYRYTTELKHSGDYKSGMGDFGLPKR